MINDQHPDESAILNLFKHLTNWARDIYKKRFFVLITSLSCSMIGMCFEFFRTPEYEATFVVSIDKKEGVSGLANIASQFGVSIGGSSGGTFEGDNLLVILRSRRLIQKVLLSTPKVDSSKTLLINDLVSADKYLENDWLELGIFPVTNPMNVTSRLDSALGEVYETLLEESLRISKLDKDLSIVQITAKSKSESFSKFFAENLVESATEFYLNTRTSQNKKNIAKLEHRIDSVKSELKIALYNSGVESDQALFTMVSSAKVKSKEAQMNVTMLTALYGELIKNLELSKTIAAREEPLITIIDTPHYPYLIPKLYLKSFIINWILGTFISSLVVSGIQINRILSKVVNNNKQRLDNI